MFFFNFRNDVAQLMKVFFVVQESQLRDVLEWLKSLDQRVVSVTFLSFFSSVILN